MMSSVFLLALDLSLRPPFRSPPLSYPSLKHFPILSTDRTLTLELGADATFAAVKAAVEAKQGEFQVVAVFRRRQAIDKRREQRLPSFSARLLSLSSLLRPMSRQEREL